MFGEPQSHLHRSLQVQFQRATDRFHKHFEVAYQQLRSI